MWHDLADDELRERLARRLTGVANPEEQIRRLVRKRDDPKVAEQIEEILER